MSQQELLRLVVEALERAGIDYMITGSVVSSLQGEPRSTHDIDFVVAVDQLHVGAIVSAFPPPRFYLDEQAARQAVRSRGMFNLIDTESGDKVVSGCSRTTRSTCRALLAVASWKCSVSN